MKDIRVLMMIIFFGCVLSLSAQELIGFELTSERVGFPEPGSGTVYFDAHLILYYRGTEPVDKPVVNVNLDSWNLDIPLVEHVFLEDNIQYLRYTKEIATSNNFFVVFSIQDSSLAINAKNAPSGNLYPLYNHAYTIPATYSDYSTPSVFTSYQNEASFDNGIYYHNPEMYDPDGDTMFYYFPSFLNDSLAKNFHPPAATDTFMVDFLTGDIIWDQPIETGKYLIGVEIWDWAFSTPTSGTVSDIKRRIMQVEVTEADLIVATQESQKQIAYTKVYPNPATGKTTLRFLSRHNTQALLSLHDLSGRSLLSYDISISTGLNYEEIDLEGIPPGVYLITLQTEKGDFKTKKLVVL